MATTALPNLLNAIVTQFKAAPSLSGVKIYDGIEIDSSDPTQWIAIGHDGTEDGEVTAANVRNEYKALGAKSMFEDGTINWRKVVKPEYLVPNRQRTQETDVTKIEEKDLLILLGGIKELAQIRGYTKVEYKVVAASENYFATSCRITWLPNYETEGKEIIFEALADASTHNTKSFARFFLAAIAENRAFVRCVRNFLRINIVGQDEIGAKTSFEDLAVENPVSPAAVLSSLMKEKSVTLDQVKKRLAKDGYQNAENLVSINEIPKPKIFELIERIKKAS